MEPIAPRAGRPAPRRARDELTAAFRVYADEWLTKYLRGSGGPPVGIGIASTLDLPIRLQDGDAYGAILHHITSGGDGALLDVLHYALIMLARGPITHRAPGPARELDMQLTYANSVWMATNEGLVRRTDPAAEQVLTNASSPSDAASAHLRHAWDKAYARNGDASDAWDHAIKAVEAVLVNAVVPKQAQGQLGHVVGELGNRGAQWDVGLLFNAPDVPRTPPTEPVEALVGMLRLIYPNPDRHEGGTPREPTEVEARMAVSLASVIVQWAREGLITKR